MMVDMDQTPSPPLTSIQISGPILSSLLNRFTSSAQSNFHGLLFGHVTHSNPSQFTDHESPITTITSTATITSFITTLHFPNHDSFSPGVIGLFSARKKSPIRPSVTESSLISQFSNNNNCVFLLITSPVSEGKLGDEGEVHRIEYRAYECLGSFGLAPRSLNVVNIGPTFRPPYGSFSPTLPLPVGPGTEVVNSMADRNEDDHENDHENDAVRRLGVLMGPQAKDYTTQLEGLYKGMLDKIDKLAVLVDDTSSTVFQQEKRNMKLRFKIAGLE